MTSLSLLAGRTVVLSFQSSLNYSIMLQVPCSGCLIDTVLCSRPFLPAVACYTPLLIVVLSFLSALIYSIMLQVPYSGCLIDTVLCSRTFLDAVTFSMHLSPMCYAPVTPHCRNFLGNSSLQ